MINRPSSSFIKEINAQMELELQFAPSDVVVQSLTPDNVLPAGPLQIKLSGRENKLHVEITGCKRIETLIATIEDILQAVQVVEKTTETKIQQNQS
jgi:hypothetical protein